MSGQSCTQLSRPGILYGYCLSSPLLWFPPLPLKSDEFKWWIILGKEMELVCTRSLISYTKSVCASQLLCQGLHASGGINNSFIQKTTLKYKLLNKFWKCSNRFLVLLHFDNNYYKNCGNLLDSCISVATHCFFFSVVCLLKYLYLHNFAISKGYFYHIVLYFSIFWI